MLKNTTTCFENYKIYFLLVDYFVFPDLRKKI